jgi:hypothetical protein
MDCKIIMEIIRWFKSIQRIATGVCFTVLMITCSPEQEAKPGWPSITRETKPWTRWWWHGNALTKEGITTEMEAYQKAGLGGLEITPIYGVFGEDDQFINYLSPEWMELFLYTLKEAERLDLGIDMATGTGWPFGGPWVTSEDACKNMHYKVFELKQGESLKEKLEFMQQPLLRAVGNQVYEVHQSFSTEPVHASGTIQEPLMKREQKKLDIRDLVEPIANNKNLQALALDQVQFEKPLKLLVLMGYSDNGAVINLTTNVDATGKLNWVAPEGNWKLYALFEGWHGKMVERAGPGGEGNVIDHFSATALKNYLNRFDSAFAGKDVQSLRSFFNDSYEVDDARGSADWTPTLFEEFIKRRGYDLREHLPALFSKSDDEMSRRILSDYRETISEMLLDNFTKQWATWAHGKSALVRNQAHGSPANILDLYATVDIPEIEGVEPLRIKMASSAGNVTGKKLVSSESATWLNEHFESNLSDIKFTLDRFMLNGVNHIFYHGTTYSPPNEPWPGRLFYAAVHLNPRNSLWKDFDALNNYAARCQSFLQNSTPDNDVLLYYPVYDRFATPGNEMIEHFDGIGKQFENSAFERAAKAMQENGYAFDYISDKQIGNVRYEMNKLKTEGNSFYQTLIIPKCEFIPARTLQKIISLAENGATIISIEGLPTHASGYSNLERNQNIFNETLNKLKDQSEVSQSITEIKVGKGRVLVAENTNTLLSYATIRKETMKNLGIDFIRKKEVGNRTVYMIVNQNNELFEGWLPLDIKSTFAVLYDPMTGDYGKATTRVTDKGNLEISIRLTSKQALVIETYEQEPKINSFNNYSLTETKTPLPGTWEVTFIEGGPTLPTVITTEALNSWTDFGGAEYQNFSGTASYKMNFKKPESAEWVLDLGTVKESAEVFLNGKTIGTLIGPVYQIHLNRADFKDVNVLEIQVSNLMANRIADLDKRNIFWKKFYNVNFPARKSENRKNGLFDASGWGPRESGLMGPVLLIERLSQK